MLHFRSQFPTLVVLVLLAGLGVWGIRYEWKVPRFSSLWSAPEPEEASAAIEVSPEDASISDANERAFQNRRIVFPSEKIVEGAGIHITPVEKRDLTDYITANGVIDYNQNYVAHLSTRVTGIARIVRKQVGESVEENEVLALIESPEVGKAKADFLQYLVLVDIKRKIFERLRPEVVPERRIQEAEADLRETRIRLVNAEQALLNFGLPVAISELEGKSEKEQTERIRHLGIDRNQMRELPTSEQQSTNFIPLKASFPGRIVSRDIVKGEIVSPARAQFTVVDIRTMWLMLEIRNEDKHRLKEREEVRFRPDSAPETTPIQGKVDWISTEVDEKTRTLRARVEVKNPDGQLRARIFGTAKISVRTVQGALTIPEEAVQDEEGIHVVFVQKSPTTFESRLVKVGIRDVVPMAGRDVPCVQVLEGLEAGDRIVTTGSHALKAELLKSRIGSED